MCSGKILAAVYYDVFRDHVVPDILDYRIKMQKAIYLINEMGVSFGDYNFIWYKYGPYSCLLDKETKALLPADISEDKSNCFNNRAKKANEFVREIMQKPDFTSYTTAKWAEILGSLHYIKTHMYYRLDDDAILGKVNSIKPDLCDKKSNIEALHRISKIHIIEF